MGMNVFLVDVFSSKGNELLCMESKFTIYKNNN